MASRRRWRPGGSWSEYQPSGGGSATDLLLPEGCCCCCRWPSWAAKGLLLVWWASEGMPEAGLQAVGVDTRWSAGAVAVAASAVSDSGGPNPEFYLLWRVRDAATSVTRVRRLLMERCESREDSSTAVAGSAAVIADCRAEEPISGRHCMAICGDGESWLGKSGCQSPVRGNITINETLGSCWMVVKDGVNGQRCRDAELMTP